MIRKESFGTLSDGRQADCYILKNDHGMEAWILTIGADIYRIRVPREDGSMQDVVLSYEDAPAYEVNHGSLGSCVGPVANRIGGASFELNGREYKLDVNNGPNNLHSGSGNTGKKLWKAEVEGEDLVLRISLPDGQAGFPGNRDLKVTYRLTEDDTLEIEYQGTTDQDTLMNMTNHAYFNLWDVREHVLDTQLWIDADCTTEADPGLIPTGRLAPVEGTPFDFRTEKPIGQDAFRKDAQLEYGQGYDHNFVLNGSGYRKVASAWHPVSCLCMEVYTDQPGVQLYTANTLGAPFGRNRGFCLETQHYPDSIHYPEFPTTVLKAGETYYTKTGYRFVRETR